MRDPAPAQHGHAAGDRSTPLRPPAARAGCNARRSRREAAAADASHNQDGIVAIVNDQPISEYDLRQRMALVMSTSNIPSHAGDEEEDPRSGSRTARNRTDPAPGSAEERHHRLARRSRQANQRHPDRQPHDHGPAQGRAGTRPRRCVDLARADRGPASLAEDRASRNMRDA